MKQTALILLLVLFTVTGVTQSNGDYRSKQSGNWHESTSWQTFNGTAFVDASTAPSYNNGIITIKNGHTITIVGEIGVDQVVVESGATLQNNSSIYLYDGPGTDLTINGTLNGSNINGDFENKDPDIINNGIINTPGGVSARLTNEGAINITNGFGLRYKTLVNNGTINWHSGTIGFYAAGIINNADGIFTANSNDQMYRNDNGGSYFNNAGTFVKTSTGLTAVGIGFTNTGTIKANGVFNFYASYGFNNVGIIEPGTPIGILEIIETQPFTPTSTLQIEIKDGSSAGVGHDQFTMKSPLTLAGTLKVVKTGNVPEGLYTIIEVTSGIISGSFATVDLPAGCSILINPTSVVLKVVEPDTDQDGVVDSQDCAHNDPTKWRNGIFYKDADADTYTTGGAVTICYGAATPTGYTTVQKGTDCDDSDASKWRSGTFYKDTDGDTYTTGQAVTICYGATPPTGYSTVQKGNDCNDNNLAINPGATEICGNNVDENCDGTASPCAPLDTDKDGTPDAADCAPNDATKWRNGTFYKDTDGDTYTTGAAVTLCYGTNTPQGYSTTQKGTDCNDNDAAINPGASEKCGDGKDNNCNTQTDEGCNQPEPTVFYSKPTGNLHSLASWGINADGTGAAPANFGEGKTFKLANRSGNYVMTGNWTVQGTLDNPSGGQLKLNGYTLSLATLTGTGTLKGSPTSSLIIAGTSGGNFGNINFSNVAGDSLKSFTLNRNGANASATIVRPLSIFDVLTVTGGTLHTGAKLTLKSTASGTARVAPVDGKIEGNVTVERYIPARRAWRLMNAPVGGKQTINQAWQEGATTSSPNPNPAPGYGTFITQKNGSVANGFDQNTNPWPYQSIASLKSFTASGDLQAVTNTEKTLVGNKPYMLFVRGDRSVELKNDTIPANNTTLRATGPLLSGTQTISVQATGFTAVANPYASPINFATITRESVHNSFYVWDPKLGTVGAYVNVSYDGNKYDTTPKAVSSIDQYIQSGQSFIVHAEGGRQGKITIKESDKATNAAKNVFRVAVPESNTQYGLRINLQNRQNPGYYLLDEAVISYGDRFSNDIDEYDVKKLDNIMENLSIRTKSHSLMVERKSSVVSADTIYLQLNNATAKTYTFEFNPTDLQDMKSVVLEDRYMHTKIPVSLNEPTRVDFMVGADAASSGSDRFRVLLTRKLLPGMQIMPMIKAYPNPVVNGNVSLEFNDVAKGRYHIEITNGVGQVISRKIVHHNGENSTHQFQLGATITSGVYQLRVTGDQWRTTIKLFKK